MMRNSALLVAACLTACGGADFDGLFDDSPLGDSGNARDSSASGGTGARLDAGDDPSGGTGGAGAAPSADGSPRGDARAADVSAADVSAADASAGHARDSALAPDAGPEAGADATADARSGACERAIRVFMDGDKDGFGDPTTERTACSIPEGYVDNGDDCYDLNSSAKPGQTNSFPTDRGDGSFDYDCDGDQTVQDTAKGFCPGIGVCIVTVGWEGEVPECGAQHPWVTGCGTLAICPTETEPRVQRCR